MFRCEICEKLVGEHVQPQRIITETRPTRYAMRSGANTRMRVRKGSRDDHGGLGWEIVREVLACDRCAEASPPIPLPAAVREEGMSTGSG